MKATLRRTLKSLLPYLPYRGRHRISDQLGSVLAPNDGPLVEVVNDFRLRLDHDLSVCRLMYYGVYEGSFVNFLKRTLRKGDTFLDLGANIGYISAVAHGLVGKNGRVISCEPSPRCTNQVLEDNPELPKGMEWVQAAVMDRDGTFPFCETPRVISHGFGRVLHGEVRENEIVTEVKAIQVDTLLKERNIEHVHFMKIDVEGCERIVLEGAKDLLARRAVDHILVETTNSNTSQDSETRAIFNLLGSAGMEPYLPNAAGILRNFDLDLNSQFRTDVIWKFER